MKAWELDNMRKERDDAFSVIEEQRRELEGKIKTIEIMTDVMNDKDRQWQYLTSYINLLSSIPEACGTYKHEMNDAVTALHELMGFKKHTKRPEAANDYR